MVSCFKTGGAGFPNTKINHPGDRQRVDRPRTERPLVISAARSRSLEERWSECFPRTVPRGRSASEPKQSRPLGVRRSLKGYWRVSMNPDTRVMII